MILAILHARERFYTIWCMLFQQEQKAFKEHMAESIWFWSKDKYDKLKT